jgi:hypothetical protein
MNKLKKTGMQPYFEQLTCIKMVPVNASKIVLKKLHSTFGKTLDTFYLALDTDPLPNPHIPVIIVNPKHWYRFNIVIASYLRSPCPSPPVQDLPRRASQSSHQSQMYSVQRLVESSSNKNYFY